MPLVQRYVSTKLEVSNAFLFRENRKHGKDRQTDGRGATLNAALYKVRSHNNRIRLITLHSVTAQMFAMKWSKHYLSCAYFSTLFDHKLAHGFNDALIVQSGPTPRRFVAKNYRRHYIRVNSSQMCESSLVVIIGRVGRGRPVAKNFQVGVLSLRVLGPGESEARTV